MALLPLGLAFKRLNNNVSGTSPLNGSANSKNQSKTENKVADHDGATSPNTAIAQILSESTSFGTENRTVMVMLQIKNTIWCGCDDGAICVWDVHKRTVLQCFRAHSGPVTSMIYHQDYVWSICQQESIVKLWKTTDFRLHTSSEWSMGTAVQLISRRSSVWLCCRNPAFLIQIKPLKSQSSAENHQLLSSS